MEKKITGVLIDTEDGTAKTVTVEDSLNSFYKLLHCDIIDIVNRSIGGKRFDIICDDEGLLRESPKVSGAGRHDEPMLVGSLLVVGPGDDEGELTSLPEADCEYVLDHITTVWRINEKAEVSVWRMLYGVDY